MLDWHSCQICYPLEIKLLSLLLPLIRYTVCGPQNQEELPVYEYDSQISVCNSEDGSSEYVHRCSVVPTCLNEWQRTLHRFAS